MIDYSSKDKHPRMFSSIFIVFVLYSLAGSEQVDQLHPTNLIAWTDENIDLLCGNNPSVNRYWKRGEEILTMANVVWTSNSRIESINQSIILRINNAGVDDEGQYTCVVNTKPIQRLTFNLLVKEFTCESLEKPLNGYFKEDSRSSEADSYKVNDRIQYFCNRGYELVGEAIRTCSGPPHGWTPHEPSCEPDYIVRLQKSVVVIGNKMTEMENKITSLESIMTSMDYRITTVEKKTATIEQCDLRMSSGQRNGHSVSEFKWVIENFNGKVPTQQQSTNILNSRTFCAQFPGYKFGLRMKLFYDKSYGINLVLYSSEDDNKLEWPFNTRFDMTIVNSGGSETQYKTFAGHQSSCIVNQPAEETVITCDTYSVTFNGYGDYLRHILTDNTMVVKLYIYK